MSTREELLQAALELAASGQPFFIPNELIEQVRRNGSNYADVTIRTHVCSWMCANAPANIATGKGEFFRVSRGLYKLNDQTRHSSPSPVRKPVTPPQVKPVGDPNGPTEFAEGPIDWYWEGHVQSLLVSHLTKDGWSIRRVADTASKEHGCDIEAVRDGVRLLVEVKGYPSSIYTHGPREGQARTVGSVPTQARAYFSHALLSDSSCEQKAVTTHWYSWPFRH